MRRCIPANTAFLSPREQQLARYLFGEGPELIFFGGYPQSERQMLCYLPDYLDSSTLWEENGPVCCLRATFYEGDCPTHRDFLGALMGLGLSRDTIGDILVDQSRCDFFTTREMVPFLLQNFTHAGRATLHLERIDLQQAHIPPQKFHIISDTLASLRLDSVVSSGFRISRSAAATAIGAGKVSIDGLPCEKPDRPVQPGNRISLRGSGKILFASAGALTKKGRIPVQLHRFE